MFSNETPIPDNISVVREVRGFPWVTDERDGFGRQEGTKSVTRRRGGSERGGRTCRSYRETISIYTFAHTSALSTRIYANGPRRYLFHPPPRCLSRPPARYESTARSGYPLERQRTMISLVRVIRRNDSTDCSGLSRLVRVGRVGSMRVLRVCMRACMRMQACYMQGYNARVGPAMGRWWW